MKHKRVLWTVLTVIGLLLMGAVAVNAQADTGKIVVINYVGSELIFTLDGTAYRVPGTEAVPEGGKMEFSLVPGLHKYSGAVPGGPGANGQVDLLAGDVWIVGARVEQTPAVVSPEGLVLEKPKDKLVLFAATEEPGIPQPPPQAGPLQAIPTGKGALVLDNYIGEEMTVDIEGMAYTVPANGRLQVNLDAGEYTYTASVVTSSLNDTAKVVMDGYTGLGFSRDIAAPVEYKVGEPEPTPVPLAMHVTVVDLSGMVVGEPQATEEAVVETPAQPAATPESLGPTGIAIKNYTGATLTFTILNEQYDIGVGVLDTVIKLDKGEYSYTASVPGSDFNGLVRVGEGQVVGMSVARGAEGQPITVYFE